MSQGNDIHRRDVFFYEVSSSDGGGVLLLKIFSKSNKWEQ